MKRNYSNILLAAGLILMASLARVVNHEMHLYNLAPVAALGLFSGAVIKDKRFAYMLPLVAMLMADLYFQFFTSTPGFYGREQWFVYGGMALVTLLGTAMHKANPLKIAGFSLIGSIVFFIVSNFGCYVSGMWGNGIHGLVTTYTMALPFFKNTIVSDLAGNTLLFGLYFMAQRSISAKTQRA